MQDGRALQAGTSHFLGQNFAKSANIKFQSKEGKMEYAYTTSWGVSTRLIGGLIMTHADDEGMVVPPKIAPYQVVIVPIIRDEATRDQVLDYARDLGKQLSGQIYDGEKVRVKVDERNKESVDKGWEWVRKGAPIVCEVGLRDIEKQGVMLKTRIHINTPEWKKPISLTDFVGSVSERLTNIQQTMFNRAKERLEGNLRTDIRAAEEMRAYFETANAFVDGNDKPVAFVRGKWCEDPATEELLKEMKISIRCIPEDQTGTTGKCLLTDRDATLDVIYARSY